MTVRELKEKLEQFPENCVVLVPNKNLYKDFMPKWYVVATNVVRGVNEVDGCVFIDDDVEEN